MLIAEILQKMIAFSDGNIHDIDHLVRVWTYARTIGQLEGLDNRTQQIVETAAIVHDIACPLCREKYGSTNGTYQEREGEPLARAFLEEFDMPDAMVERVVWLVGHHHSLQNIDGMDHQILIEADYIANATENGWKRDNAKNFLQKMMKTASGRRLLSDIYGL